MSIYKRYDGKYIYSPTGDQNSEVIFDTSQEANVAQSQSDYIAAVKSANKAVWDGINELLSLQAQWNALDYGTTLVDPTGAYTSAQVGAVVFAATDALKLTLATGVATNMATLL